MTTHDGKQAPKRGKKPKVIHPTYGPNLRWWRETRGLSTAELAAAAGVSKSLIHALEVQRSNPGYERSCAIAKALGISVALIWDHHDSPSGPLRHIAER